MPAKFTKESFAEKGEVKYGPNRHDYSGVIYIDSTKNVRIRCIPHDHWFEQTPSNHLRGSNGCPRCPGPKGAKRKLDVEELKERGRIMFNGVYTYDNIGNPMKAKDPINVHCTIHNLDFPTTFDAHIYHGTKCPLCGREAQAQSNYIKEDLSDTYNLAALFPEIAGEWSHRNDTAPEDYLPYSHASAQWICVRGHEWDMPISNRTKGEQNCPVCNNRQVHDDNNFGNNPDAIAWWSVKNKKTPAEYTKASGETVWFTCNCETRHEFPMRICNFHKGERCPFKGGKQLDWSNSAVAKIPEFAEHWDFEKNKCDPTDLSYGSGKKCWLKCPCGHSWETSPNFVKNSIVCPECDPTGYSKISIRWLNEVAERDGIFIQHAENIGEYKIPETNYRADGYCEVTNTIYEFHGDFWHGNPRKYGADEMNNVTGKTHGEKYRETIAKEQKIRDLGYNLIVMWEMDY